MGVLSTSRAEESVINSLEAVTREELLSEAPGIRLWLKASVSSRRETTATLFPRGDRSDGVSASGRMRKSPGTGSTEARSSH